MLQEARSSVEAARAEAIPGVITSLHNGMRRPVLATHLSTEKMFFYIPSSRLLTNSKWTLGGEGVIALDCAVLDGIKGLPPRWRRKTITIPKPAISLRTPLTVSRLLPTFYTLLMYLEHIAN
jgi:hypothetical protein